MGGEREAEGKLLPGEFSFLKPCFVHVAQFANQCANGHAEIISLNRTPPFDDDNQGQRQSAPHKALQVRRR